MSVYDHAELRARVFDAFSDAELKGIKVALLELYKAKRNAMFRALDEPKRIVKALCPDCGKATSTIGTVQTFRCPCSPTIERSVWDARQT